MFRNKKKAWYFNTPQLDGTTKPQAQQNEKAHADVSVQTFPVVPFYLVVFPASEIANAIC